MSVFLTLPPFRDAPEFVGPRQVVFAVPALALRWCARNRWPERCGGRVVNGTHMGGRVEALDGWVCWAYSGFDRQRLVTFARRQE